MKFQEIGSQIDSFILRIKMKIFVFPWAKKIGGMYGFPVTETGRLLGDRKCKLCIGCSRMAFHEFWCNRNK